jgi:hypothetical protein
MSEQADAVLTLAAEGLMTRYVRTCSSEDQHVEIMQVKTLQRMRHCQLLWMEHFRELSGSVIS